MGADETATERQKEERRRAVEEGGKKEGRRRKRKIKSREGCWVGSGEMTGKRAQHERSSKIVRNHANTHLGEKKLLCIEMTLICMKDLAMEGWREERTFGTKGCSDLFLSRPHHPPSYPCSLKPDLRPAPQRGGLDVRGWSCCVFVTGVITDKLMCIFDLELHRF